MNVESVFGPIAHLFSDDSISEIIIDQKDDVYYEKQGKIENANAVFKSEDEILALILRVFQFTGRTLDANFGVADCRLPDGTRVAATNRPISLNGPALIIRKMPKQKLNFSDLENFKAIDASGREILKKLVAKGKSLLVAGNAGSGKTTLANVIIDAINPSWRVVTVEKTATIQTDRKRILKLETAHSREEEMTELVKKAGLFRADYLVINEFTGPEIFEAIRLAREGFSTMGTIGAESTIDALKKAELLCLMGQYGLGIEQIRFMVSTGFGAVVYQERMSSGKRKVSNISLVDGQDENGRYKLTSLYSYIEEEDRFLTTKAGQDFLKA
jgi:pilus assembly protein CpaF